MSNQPRSRHEHERPASRPSAATRHNVRTAGNRASSSATSVGSRGGPNYPESVTAFEISEWPTRETWVPPQPDLN